MDTFKLGEAFMLGTATSSTQIEGGVRNSNWYQWCETGHISDSSSCYTACDHWNRVKQDTDILKSLNVQTHRMSLEWSRIEPSPGEFSADAVRHYRSELQLLLAYNIRPLVTLHHFSEPLWFQNMGGWMKPQNSDYFIEYAKYVVENLGDLVCDWVTFNEPNVYALFGYAVGCYPPGIRNVFTCRRVLSEIITTHLKLYDLIHSARKQNRFEGKTMVSAAIHIRVFDGITGIGKIAARLADYIFNELSMEGRTTGHLKFPLRRKGFKYKAGVYADFLGINYYTRNIVEFALDPSNYFHRIINDKDLDKTDLGWDIYPKGIYQVCKKYYSKYKIPIYITENGISDRYDNRRPRFIAEHLAWLAKAIREGVNIERYYHWTLMDNFEWLYGETGNFGLYHCDFKTQERTARKSVVLFSEICSNKELSEKMIDGLML
jgi:beta-glucosidase